MYVLCSFPLRLGWCSFALIHPAFIPENSLPIKVSVDRGKEEIIEQQ